MKTWLWRGNNRDAYIFLYILQSLQIEVFLLVTIALLGQFLSLPKSKMFEIPENDV